VEKDSYHTHSITKGAFSHEQCNTRYEISAIPNAVCAKERSAGSEQEIQQAPLIHLLLAGTVGWKHGELSMPQPKAQGSKSLTRGKPVKRAHRTVVSSI
jgi:hypothetical protein